MKSEARLGDSAATMHGTVGGRADIGRTAVAALTLGTPQWVQCNGCAAVGAVQRAHCTAPTAVCPVSVRLLRYAQCQRVHLQCYAWLPHCPRAGPQTSCSVPVSYTH